MNTQTTAATAPQFDLSNPQHLAMRKLMADVYARYVNALNENEAPKMALYLGIGMGLERVATYVLADPVIRELCESLYFLMLDLKPIYSERAAA